MSLISKLILSAIPLILLALYEFVPKIKVDPLSITLVALVVLPWIIDYIKSIEISGIKITFNKVKAATDKIIESQPRGSVRARVTDHAMQPPTGGLEVGEHASKVEIASAEIPITTNMWTLGENNRRSTNLWAVYESDPNLALVGIRIEIETRLRKIAEANELNPEKLPPRKIIQFLHSKKILSSEMAAGLLDLIDFGNSAAHGAEVNRDAAEWVLTMAPRILSQLDSLADRDTR